MMEREPVHFTGEALPVPSKRKPWDANMRSGRSARRRRERRLHDARGQFSRRWALGSTAFTDGGDSGDRTTQGRRKRENVKPTQILATWVIVQLLIIGGATTAIHNEMRSGVLDCHPKPAPWMLGALLPLAAFANTDSEIRRYCEARAVVERDNMRTDQQRQQTR